MRKINASISGYIGLLKDTWWERGLLAGSPRTSINQEEKRAYLPRVKIFFAQYVVLAPNHPPYPSKYHIATLGSRKDTAVLSSTVAHRTLQTAAIWCNIAHYLLYGTTKRYTLTWNAKCLDERMHIKYNRLSAVQLDSSECETINRGRVVNAKRSDARVIRGNDTGDEKNKIKTFFGRMRGI